MRVSRSLSRRRGYSLVLVAMMLFGLFAMAALVIDLGFARLAQRQMQSAADSAALEGLRGEGITDYDARQDAAERFIAWTFDDDLDATNGDDGIAGDGGAFGAGPMVDFSGSAGNPDLNASQLMTVDSNNTAYKPVMQKGAAPIANNQFDIAIQRGGVVLGQYDLFAEGPAVPYLFARGSMLDRERVGDGIFVGGVSRAITDRALSVGLPVSDTVGTQIYPGAVAIGYSLADWNGLRSNPRQIDAPKTLVGQTVIDGGEAAVIDGYCCIFTSIDSEDRVIGFGWIDGLAAVPQSVAAANAIGHQGFVWNQIDATVRDTVLTQNDSIVGGLLVARLASGF